MKGIYSIFIQLHEEKNIKVGSLGELRFPAGKYVYVGSAMNSVEKRIQRHKSKEKKKHWHIDYLTEKAKVKSHLILDKDGDMECKLAETMKDLGRPVEDFGCTDCNCVSHLFKLDDS